MNPGLEQFSSLKELEESLRKQGYSEEKIRKSILHVRESLETLKALRPEVGSKVDDLIDNYVD
jgi:hypothetical protein